MSRIPHGYLFSQNAPTLLRRLFITAEKKLRPNTPYSVHAYVHSLYALVTRACRNFQSFSRGATSFPLSKIMSYHIAPPHFTLSKETDNFVDTYFLQQVSFSRQRALFVFVNDSLFIRNIIFLFLDHFSQDFRQLNVIDLKIQLNRKYNKRKLESSILPDLAVV